MSTELSSRSHGMTFGNVIQLISVRPELSPRRRGDLLSACHRFCRILGREPRDVPADPEEVRSQLAQLSATKSGLSLGSFRNLKSLVRQALLTARVTSVPRRSRIPLGPDWQRLLPQIDNRHQRYSVSHLARYFSARGLRPMDIDGAVMPSMAET